MSERRGDPKKEGDAFAAFFRAYVTSNLNAATTSPCNSPRFRA